MPKLIRVFAGRTVTLLVFVMLRLKCPLSQNFHSGRGNRLNPHLPGGLCHPYLMYESISSFRGARFIVILLLIENSVCKQCRPDQTSDLGLHCLPMSQKWDARLILVNSAMSVRLTRCPVLVKGLIDCFTALEHY